MAAKQVSIEYAHIYTNHQINEEHEQSLKALSRLVSPGTNLRPDTSLVVMIDDYSFPDPTFDYDGFSAWLTLRGYTPDVVFRESQLIPLCDETLRLIGNQRLRDNTSTYIKNNRYPCSLFIAAWYLLRLGHLHHPSFPVEQRADRIVSILPASFKPFEDRALKFLESINLFDHQEIVEHHYIDVESKAAIAAAAIST